MHLDATGVAAVQWMPSELEGPQVNANRT
jgi:hypothetical protein